MSEKFTVEIISPDKSILKTEANEVTIPSFEGEIGILKDHIPLITFLRPGLIKILNGSEKTFFVEEGTVEFSNNILLILSSSAKIVSEIDTKFINNLIDDTEKKIKSKILSDKENYILSYKLEVLKTFNQ
tara:strand:+ start:663 stop:1052 length:390 start_codon:yes stop_codon:yes gene_type:complete